MIALVALSQRLGPPGPEEHRIEAVGARLAGVPLFTRDDIVANAAGADIVILGAVEPFDAPVLKALPRLRAVVRRGVGYDNVDLAAATELGVVVATVPDASIEEVSDHALAMLLALERGLSTLDHAVRDGRWATDPVGVQSLRMRRRRLAGLTLGVVGFGRIGRALVRKAKSLYPTILVADPVVDPSAAAAAGAQLVPLVELLERADHISLHVPGDASNRQLIGATELAFMRPGAILVNTARGGVVDEDAVADAVRTGRLGGAGLDVTVHEPVPAAADVLQVRDDLLLTGHSAAWSDSAAQHLAAGSVDAVLDLLAGRPPRSVVNPEVLRSPALRAGPLQLGRVTLD